MSDDATPSTVLIVDDDADTVATYASVLRHGGYVVRTALTAEEGLEDVDAFVPDAIVLDLHLPDVDGVEFLRRLRANGHAIPVVIVTGDYFVADDVAAELRRLSAEVRLKPLWFDDLTNLVRTLTISHG